MSDLTKIQWCDSTVNPIMGCGGCELFPTPGEVLGASDQAVGNVNGAGFQSRPLFKGLVDGSFDAIPEPGPGHKRAVNTTNIWHLREPFYAEVKDRHGRCRHGREAGKAAKHAVERAITCYAAKLHLNKGSCIAKPGRVPKKGYAPIFEHLTRYEGRVAGMAGKADLLGRLDPANPWKGRLPRMIFVSDMGDAFTRKSDFAFLDHEVMGPILSDKGRRHLWLWLTKRPDLMADFAKKHGAFPANLCAMTTVTSQETLGRIDELRGVDARIRGLSIEPLWERIPPAKLNLKGIDWVIAGGESGAREHVREFPLEWADELRDHCRKQGVAFFLKQLGRKPTRNGEMVKLKDTHGGDWNEWDEDLRVREFPRQFHEYRKEETRVNGKPRPAKKPKSKKMPKAAK